MMYSKEGYMKNNPTRWHILRYITYQYASYGECNTDLHICKSH